MLEEWQLFQQEVVAWTPLHVAHFLAVTGESTLLGTPTPGADLLANRSRVLSARQRRQVGAFFNSSLDTSFCGGWRGLCSYNNVISNSTEVSEEIVRRVRMCGFAAVSPELVWGASTLSLLHTFAPSLEEELLKTHKKQYSSQALRVQGVLRGGREQFFLPFAPPFNTSTVTANPLVVQVLREYMQHEPELDVYVLVHADSGSPGTAVLGAGEKHLFNFLLEFSSSLRAAVAP